MKTKSTSFSDPLAGLEFDLRLPIWIVILALFLAAIIVAMVNVGADQLLVNYQLSLLIFTLATLVSILSYSYPKLANPIMLLGVLGLIVYLVRVLGYVEALPIILLPGVVAFFISGWLASIVLAIAESVLLLAGWNLGQTRMNADRGW